MRSHFLYLLAIAFALSSAVTAQTISSFSPAAGPVGTLVTITGSNLSNPTAFTIGGTSAIVVSSTGSTLVGLVMPGATTGAVSVTTAGGTANGSSNFAVSATLAPAVQQGLKLVGTGAVGTAHQGQSVAISADGNTAIVGGNVDNTGQGAAWVYTRNSGAWSQQGAKLVCTGNVGAAYHGYSVALSADGNTAMVGGMTDNNLQGAAWVWTRSGTVWTQQSKLVGTGNTGVAYQGYSVALSADGNRAIVGGPADNNFQGAAWMFVRSGTIWSQQGTKLVGTGNIGAARQGESVTISGDGNTAIVGGFQDNNYNGAAWAFVRSGTAWAQHGAKLVGTGAVGAARQGISVTLSADGNTAIVGGHYDNGLQGAAWAYARSGTTWAQQGAKLVGFGNTGVAQQGYSVAVSADGSTAMVGGLGDNSGQGATWAFVRSGAVWLQQGTKRVGIGSAGVAYLGWSLALSADGTTAMVGGYGDNVQQGAAWAFVAPLISTGPISGSPFVQGVATSVSVSFTVNVALSAGNVFTAQLSNAAGSFASPTAIGTLTSTTGGTIAAAIPSTATAGTGYRIRVVSSSPAATGTDNGTNLSILTYTVTTGAISGSPLFQGAPVSVPYTVSTAFGAGNMFTAQLSNAAGFFTSPTVIGALAATTSGSILATVPAVTSGSGYRIRVVGSNPTINGSDNGTNLSIAVPPSPAIAGYIPASGPVGSLVTITGSNLSNVTAFSIGGVPAIVVSNTGSTIVGLVMPGTTTGSVSLSTFGGTAMGSGSFTITPTTYPATQQGDKLIGTGNAGNAEQGTSVAVSADGNTAIIGGPEDNSLQGAAWVYVRSGGVWSQQGVKLVGTGNAGDAEQGTSVALSADGNTAIVGGNRDGGDIGAAWVFVRSGGVWSQQGAKLLGTGSIGTARQGSSVSLSADGNTAIVGGRGDNSLQGAAWVYVRSGGVWVQLGTKLVGTGASGPAGQGVAVSLSADGNTAIVGGDRDNSFQGAVWIFVRSSSGATWVQQGSKLVGTGTVGIAYQGYSVSLSGDGNTAIVGGPADDGNQGAIWVYVRTGSIWAQQGYKLVGTGAAGSANQGNAVSLSADGNTAIFGAAGDNGGQGAAWVYRRSFGIWSQQGPKRVGTGNTGPTGARQGNSVSLSADGTTVIMGGHYDNLYRGAAWVFVPPPAPTITSFSPATGPVGTLVTITGANLSTPGAFTIGGVTGIVISTDDSTLVGMVMPGATTGTVSLSTPGGTVTSSFTVTPTPYPATQQGSKLVGTGNVGTGIQGTSVAVSADGNTAIVGGNSDNGDQGAAWVYVRSGGVWSQQGTKLVGTGNVGAARQGQSVSLSADGNTAIVGGNSDNGGQGAAWVYVRNGGVWSQQGTKLVGTGNVGAARQGQSVSLSADGNTAIVTGDGDNGNQGAAWVYVRNGGVWSQQGTKLVGTGNMGAARQGQSVSLSADGKTAILGGWNDNNFQGAAWVFVLTSGGVWSQQGTKLVGTGGSANARQGASVSLSADGNTTIVGGLTDNGDLGAAWVFVRSGNTWTQQGTKLVGNDVAASIFGVRQGVSVSMSADGNTAIVGGNIDNVAHGATWVYLRSGAVWTQQGSKLVGTDAVGTAEQGNSVSLSANGTTAFVGGYADNNYTGAAWAYVNPTITTGAISGSPFTQGIATAVNVPFTANSTYGAGNVFTAQLSDAAGSFASPTAIGTLTATTGGAIAAIMPVTAPAGAGYRIRVVASSPASIGTDNGTDLTILPPPEINIQGNGQSIADGSTTTQFSNNTAFGTVALAGATITKTFTIQNPGGAVLNVSTINLSGTSAASFAISGISLPITIPASGSATFTVTFSPATTGTKTATVEIASDDEDEAMYDFAITACAPDIGAASYLVTQDITDNSFEAGTCTNLIANVQPTGAATAVSGSITAIVFVQSTAPAYNGAPYVRRYHDISPAAGANSATAGVTLYYTQADFTDYNANNGAGPDLPANPTDAVSKANFRLMQQHGTSASGTPGSYTGWNGTGPANVVIDPPDGNIVWNAMASRWEVTFDVVGFSGFFAYGSLGGTPLPVTLLSMTARAEGAVNLISWTSASEHNLEAYEVERSADGRVFQMLGSVTANGDAHAYRFIDKDPLSPLAYYRLRMVDANGTYHHSGTVSVARGAGNGSVVVTAFPNPAKDQLSLRVDGMTTNGKISLCDLSGRILMTRLLITDTADFNIGDLAAGIYLAVYEDNGRKEVIRVTISR